MVAYSFKAQFAPLIESGAKLHTIRDRRKRHARPGEAIQLYTGMRTKECRKLLTPDPICVSVQPIVFYPDSVITIDGYQLAQIKIESLAIADGFDSVEDFWQFFGVPNVPIERFLITWKLEGDRDG